MAYLTTTELDNIHAAVLAGLEAAGYQRCRRTGGTMKIPGVCFSDSRPRFSNFILAATFQVQHPVRTLTYKAKSLADVPVVVKKILKRLADASIARAQAQAAMEARVNIYASGRSRAALLKARFEVVRDDKALDCEVRFGLHHVMMSLESFEALLSRVK